MSIWNLLKVHQWFNFVQFWLLPPTCLLCSKPGPSQIDLCQRCLDACPTISNPCAGCGLALPDSAQGLLCGPCSLTKREIHTTVAAFAYQQPVSHLIAQFKYHRQLAAGRALSASLLASIHQHYRAAPLPDLLLPIPLHPQRLRQRGYNQASLIANDLSNALQIPLSHYLLQRPLITPTQQGLSAQQRSQNLRGAFSVTSAEQLQRYKRIALIDDVVTTMSTVREIAQVLHAVAPALEIHVWCLARA